LFTPAVYYSCPQDRNFHAPSDQDGAPPPSPRGTDGSKDENDEARKTVLGQVVVVDHVLVGRVRIPAATGPPSSLSTPTAAGAAAAIRGSRKSSSVVLPTADNREDQRPEHIAVFGIANATFGDALTAVAYVPKLATQAEEVQSHSQTAVHP